MSDTDFRCRKDILLLQISCKSTHLHGQRSNSHLMTSKIRDVATSGPTTCYLLCVERDWVDWNPYRVQGGADTIQGSVRIHDYFCTLGLLAACRHFWTCRSFLGSAEAAKAHHERHAGIHLLRLVVVWSLLQSLLQHTAACPHNQSRLQVHTLQVHTFKTWS